MADKTGEKFSKADKINAGARINAGSTRLSFKYTLSAFNREKFGTSSLIRLALSVEASPHSPS